MYLTKPMIANKKQFSYIFLISTLMLCSTIGWSQLGTSTESVSFNLTDRVGTGFGDNIEGSFTLIAQGSTGIVLMKVFFNNEEVYSVAGNSISWRFDTKSYAIGATNITVVGFDNQNNAVQSSKIYQFLDPNLTTTLTVVVIVFAIIVTILKYRRKYATKLPTVPTKNDVQIQPPNL